MSKEQTGRPEDRKTGRPEDRKTGRPEDRKTGRPGMLLRRQKRKTEGGSETGGPNGGEDEMAV
ncbi:hypothetical protein [Sarcina sp. DSM 11001]|uniref:hypothetical protein n=1 Tax=Sarcina sp. DSM 11001 TaxID=1798184 RepID=UPI000B867407|nr:hypothetical protein [Sarcina sp. DSM 11001]